LDADDQGMAAAEKFDVDRSRVGGRVVVGLDGSPCADAALRWAYQEAGLRGGRLTAVLAWDYLNQPADHRGEPFDAGYRETDARRALDASVRRAIGEVENVERLVVCDLPGPALLSLAGEADLLVVGARGLGGFQRVVLGSVSEHVLREAPGVVAIVPEPAAEGGPELPTAGGPIVVAVDGSPTAERALCWALEEARLRSAPVQVVHAWHEPLLGGGYPVTATAHPHEWYRHAAREVLDSALARTGGAAREVRVEPIVLEGPPAAAVLDLAKGAGLLVVGSRGLGVVRGTLLGSVSRQVVHRATCPVVVVKPVPTRR
jgi:nucleotide-binding universal stress UspA family protein